MGLYFLVTGNLGHKRSQKGNLDLTFEVCRPQVSFQDVLSRAIHVIGV